MKAYGWLTIDRSACTVYQPNSLRQKSHLFESEVTRLSMIYFSSFMQI